MGHANSSTCIKVIAFGCANAITWAILLLVVSILGLLFGWGIPVLGVTASLFIGFNLGWLGIIIGLIWALVYGFIFGIIFSSIYNAIASSCACASTED